MRAFGLEPGHVLALSGRNHSDLCVPYYSALYEGLPIFGVDPMFKYDEIRSALSFTKPKIAFCQHDSAKDFESAAKALNLDMKIVTFHGGECTMEDFMNEYNSDDELNNFNVAGFEPSRIYTLLFSTSGSTGVPKAAAFTAQVVYDATKFYERLYFKQNGLYFLLSPVQWLTYSLIMIGAALTQTTVLTTSAPTTTVHVVDVINKYRPNFAIFGPTLLTEVLNNPACDLMCFDVLTVGGSRVYKDLLLKLKLRTKAKTAEVYGQSETLGVLYHNPGTPLGSCGKSSNRYQLKLVNPETGRAIDGSNVSGELYLKGPMFSEYYNNPDETAKAFSEDGWYKTGDILYKDEDGFYFYVERIKMLIKCRNYHIYPTEIEEILRELPDVVDAAVTGVPDPELGEVPAACVIRRPDSKLLAQEIKDLIASRVSEVKQLRGGVVFVDSLPLTSTGKIARTKLKELIEKSHKE